MLPTAAGQSAIVLVAFASIAGRPSASSAGNVTIVPPPAMEFMIPATSADTTTSTSCVPDNVADGWGVTSRFLHARKPPREQYPGRERSMSPTQAAKATDKAASAPSDNGTLEIKDSRSGKSYSVPILEPGTEGDTTVRAMDLRQIKVDADEFGLMTYDPAFKNTASCKSAITFIDGDKGILRYRGYPIEQLADKATFLEVSWLLRHGELPTQKEY